MTRLRRLGRRLSEQVGVWIVGLLCVGVVLWSIVDSTGALRVRTGWAGAYRPLTPAGDDHERAIRQRIAILLRPRDGVDSLAADGFGRQIEAALLYGRLAMLEEGRGDRAHAEEHMAQAVALLRAAHHPDPTEGHIRAAVAAQDSRRVPPGR